MALRNDNNLPQMTLNFEIENAPVPKKNNKIRLCLGLLITILVLFILLFVGVPLVFYCSTSFQRLVVFLNFYENPRVHDFGNLKMLQGIGGGTRNFRIPVGNGDELGVWHILSTKSMEQSSRSANDHIEDEAFKEMFKKSSQNIYLYLHGNSNTRAAKHRIELYKILRKSGHVITFDYRGYADSTNKSPTEKQVLEDAKAVYDWILKEKKDAKIVIWGHSLGTAIGTDLCMQVGQSAHLKYVVLEAPFTNMADEVREHPLGKLFSWVPYFGDLIAEPFRPDGSDFAFKSDRNIEKLSETVFYIFHAKDDKIVPFKMGEKMRDLANNMYRKKKISLIAFEHGGHDGIWNQPDFEEAVKKIRIQNSPK